MTLSAVISWCYLSWLPGGPPTSNHEPAHASTASFLVCPLQSPTVAFILFNSIVLPFLPSKRTSRQTIEKTLPTNGRQIKKRKDGKVYKRTSHLRMPEDSKTGGKEEEEKETLPLPLRNPCAPQTNRAQLPYVRSLSNPRAISQLLNPQSEKGRLERRRRAPSLSPARVSARRGAVDDVEPGRQTLSSPERETCLPFCKIG